ncbi:MAG: PEP-CTERM sorting domain-containing protein [Phycisphaerae bacterium]|nr:PEP-CTERM sorting domain-containing protein [Phycisphaerae bacterium]
MKRVLLASLCVLVITLIANANAANFQGLGGLFEGNTDSHAQSVSADGSVITGYAINAGHSFEAFRWTSGEGMVGLSGLSYSAGAGYGISGDGSNIVGYSLSTSGEEAFLWTSGGNMIGLGDLPGGSFRSIARGVSSDGTVITGKGTSALGTEAFRWTSGEGMVGLGDLAGGSFSSQANGISGDGSIIVGEGRSASGTEAFRWTSDTGMAGLGDLPGGNYYSQANGISDDGSAIVGRSRSASGYEAFLWTVEDGMIGLGALPGSNFYSTAKAVSNNGIVVGSSDIAFESGSGRAFIWDQNNGIRNLRQVLETDYNLDLSGWILSTAFGISADGTTIVGTGANPDGNAESWVAIVPEPCSLVLLGLGGLALRRRKA